MKKHLVIAAVWALLLSNVGLAYASCTGGDRFLKLFSACPSVALNVDGGNWGGKCSPPSTLSDQVNGLLSDNGCSESCTCNPGDGTWSCRPLGYGGNIKNCTLNPAVQDALDKSTKQAPTAPAAPQACAYTQDPNGKGINPLSGKFVNITSCTCNGQTYGQGQKITDPTQIPPECFQCPTYNSSNANQNVVADGCSCSQGDASSKKLDPNGHVDANSCENNKSTDPQGKAIGDLTGKTTPGSSPGDTPAGGSPAGGSPAGGAPAGGAPAAAAPGAGGANPLGGGGGDMMGMMMPMMMMGMMAPMMLTPLLSALPTLLSSLTNSSNSSNGTNANCTSGSGNTATNSGATSGTCSSGAAAGAATGTADAATTTSPLTSLENDVTNLLNGGTTTTPATTTASPTTPVQEEQSQLEGDAPNTASGTATPAAVTDPTQDYHDNTSQTDHRLSCAMSSGGSVANCRSGVVAAPAASQ